MNWSLTIISKHTFQNVGNQAFSPIANGSVNLYNLYCGQCDNIKILKAQVL